MTTTRTQSGKTPRKTSHPGYVETPGRKRGRPRKSGVAELRDDSEARDSSTGIEDDTIEVEQSPAATRSTRKRKSVHVADGELANDYATLKGPTRLSEPDSKIDGTGHFEFGGTWGVSAIMVGFPLLMYYMWLGATMYDGKLPLPADGESISHFVQRMVSMIYEGAYPSLKAWAIYWVFFVVEGAFYLLLPGIYQKGKPLPHEGGRQLTYYCSGQWSWWTTIVVACVLHSTGLFKLYTIMDEFGPLMSVAILSGILVSIIAYISALARGAQHRMTGHLIYDFFMGAELNPRMFGLLDFKMFFEVRLPWYILFLVSLGAAARQYEQFGYVSGEVAFLVMAHFLYANACSKGEECIIPTWDMYYEKWGFMLIFWNMAGVPLSYCHCTIYLSNHAPSVYHWNRYALTLLYLTYLFVYWVWDTTNSQKNRFKAQLSGHDMKRKAFPQLPWQVIENPKTIVSDKGDVILADGWYGYARKIHYTCDLFFALSWGLITGFQSPFPWFYPVFFTCMILHRAYRDIQRCRDKYGEAWREYERQVPYLFIPVC
ncbi:MAG: hypothetical protein Q9227_004542 [Pyrenula ochraceoflavens]